MGVNNVLYDRPDLDQQVSRLAALYVDGVLPTPIVQAAYAGRLQIHNASGDCWAEILDGNLPPGAYVYVDQDAQEVVVAWPAYGVTEALKNPGLESGDTSGWDVSSIGGSGTLVASTGQHSEGNYAAYWAGGRGMGSEGGIECVAVNQAKIYLYPGQRVSGAVGIGYNFAGGTPKGSRGQAWLIWYDKDDQQLGITKGDLISTRKYNHRWTSSSVAGAGPANTYYVRLAAWVTATGAGHTWFDGAQWDAGKVVGINKEGTYCLTIRVHDAAGRVADWHGCTSSLDAIAYWPCDEPSGTVIHDRSGRGNDGAVQDGVLGDGYLKTPNSGDYGDTGGTVKTPAELDANSDWTMEFIFSATNSYSSSGNIFVGHPGTFSSDACPGVNVRPTIEARVTLANNADRVDATGTNGLDGVERHIIFSWENATGTMRLYVDGTKVDTTVTDDAPQTFDSHLYLLGSTTSYWVVGAIKEIYLYNKTLTDAQALARAQTQGFA